MQLRVLLWAPLALAAAAAALNVADVPCGKPQAATKIVGGGDARPGQFPWLVSLQLDGEPWCGGTLVSQWFVVTAAHCLKNMKADRFSVVAGEHDLTQQEGKEQRLPVQAIALHPEYHALLESVDGGAQKEWTPEGGESNPFLHMGLHLALREQLATDRPAGIRSVHTALAQRLGDLHEAEHRMLDCLAETLWHAQRGGTPPDEAAYLERLRRL